MLKNKQGFEMDLLLKILLWIIFAGILLFTVYSIFKKFKVL